jgi:hypothetical protein
MASAVRLDQCCGPTEVPSHSQQYVLSFLCMSWQFAYGSVPRCSCAGRKVVASQCRFRLPCRLARVHAVWVVYVVLLCVACCSATDMSCQSDVRQWFLSVSVLCAGNIKGKWLVSVCCLHHNTPTHQMLCLLQLACPLHCWLMIDLVMLKTQYVCPPVVWCGVFAWP